MGKYNMIIQSWTALRGRELWRCPSPPHSSCEGHPHSQVRMFGAASARSLLVPEDGDDTTSLGHILLPHSSGEEWFPPILPEVPVLQKRLLALVLSASTSEKVWLCILCLPLRQRKTYLQPHRLSLLSAEEAQLPRSPFILCVLQTLANLVATAGLQLHLHFSCTGGPDWAQRSTYSLGSAWWCRTQPRGRFKSLKLWNDLEKAIKAGVRCNAFDISQPHCPIVR